MNQPSYALVTAAYNEEQFLPLTIESVLSQTVLPRRWIIVSDASRDRTEEIVLSYVKQSPIISLLKIVKEHPRNFAAQVNAINLGFADLRYGEYEFIGNLDADVSFGPTYFANLLEHFKTNPRLGLAGGVIREKDGTVITALRGESIHSVPHALQLFRRQCYEDIGGYPPLRFGGPDTYAEVMARMKGWAVKGFPHLVAQHHRYTGSVGGQLRGRFRQGLMDFSLGSDPLFEALKCLRRLRERPIALGAVCRMAGFCWAYRAVREPLVSNYFVQFLRCEQRERMRAYLSSLHKMFSPHARSASFESHDH
jgi:biofilm PGA synthesis N-glycosyltransferase PgaC